MDKKIIKTREVMHDRHLELDGMATVKQALDTMKAEQSDVVIVKKRHEHDAFPDRDDGDLHRVDDVLLRLDLPLGCCS